MRILILMSTAYAFIRLIGWPLGLTYYTQFTNLFVANVVVLQLLAPALSWSGVRQDRLRILKYMATVSITITFVVYLFILAPIYEGGFVAAYAQDHWASLCLHAVTPILTLADFFLNDAPHIQWKKIYIWQSIVPPLAWFVYILILGAFGLRWEGMAAPYAFLNYDAPAGWFGIMPQTANQRTVGVGIAYMLFILIGMVLLAGWGIYRVARERAKSMTKGDLSG